LECIERHSAAEVFSCFRRRSMALEEPSARAQRARRSSACAIAIDWRGSKSYPLRTLRRDRVVTPGLKNAPSPSPLVAKTFGTTTASFHETQQIAVIRRMKMSRAMAVCPAVRQRIAPHRSSRPRDIAWLCALEFLRQIHAPKHPLGLQKPVQTEFWPKPFSSCPFLPLAARVQGRSPPRRAAACCPSYYILILQSLLVLTPLRSNDGARSAANRPKFTPHGQSNNPPRYDSRRAGADSCRSLFQELFGHGSTKRPRKSASAAGTGPCFNLLGPQLSPRFKSNR